MATPAAHEHPLPEGQEPGRQGQDSPRHTPPAIEPLRAVPPRTILPPVALPARRSQPPVPRGPRRVGLFQKILLGDLTLWCVLSGVLSYEALRQHLAPEHALFGALVGLAVALAVAVGLKQVANRAMQLNRSALEISRGDLSKPLATERTDWLGRDEVDELTTAISNMQANLRELVGHIQRTSRSVADSADEMQESSANVSAQAENIDRSMAKINQGAEHQLQLVEKASALIARIADSIGSSAKTAGAAAETATATSTAAQAGGAAAQLAAEKIKKVFAEIEAASETVFAFGEKTQEISKIVVAITGVAQQTNLLALNAAIEAARAGEYGRGFAVVADEVRKLAESAGRSAEQISKLARDISGQSTAVVSAMKEGINELVEGREDLTTIVRSMGSITDTARKGADKVHLISDSARDQLKGSQEMVSAIRQISQVAKENASSTEAIHEVIVEQTGAVSRMTSAAQELTSLSLELQNVVSRFRLVP